MKKVSEASLYVYAAVYHYLKQFSVFPGPTEQSVNIPAQQEQQQHHYHEQPGEEEAEPCAPAAASRSEVK